MTSGHELDICECGDYRRDHVDGSGRCKMPDDLTHGFEPCLEFKLGYEYGSVNWLRICGIGDVTIDMVNDP